MKESNYVNPFSATAEKMSREFDEATMAKDVVELENVINRAINIVGTENLASQAMLYYSLGTAYGDLNRLKGTFDENAKKKVIYYFRKSIKIIESDEFEAEEYKPYVLALKEILYTNFANILEQGGRKIAAIEQLKKTLEIHSDFGMALGNLGRVYKDYAHLDFDNDRIELFHYFAYYYLKRSLDCKDPNTHSAAKASFQALIDRYHPDYIKEVLEAELKFMDYSYEDEAELKYREWCLENVLFLNPSNDLPVKELCFAGDIIQLPKMIMKLHDKPIYHGMFSQLKQEYIYARYLYYSSVFAEDEVNFADKDTYITAYTDYTQYCIRVENLKACFKLLFGMFDKIAYFLAHYFDLGIKEQDINFKSIWGTHIERGKKSYELKNQLNPENNIALSALYWIGKDFFDKFEDSPNPELKRMREIRNALEHKYVKVSLYPIELVGIDRGDGLALYISEGELYTMTMDLLKIIREVIISLALCVNIAEKPKREAAKDKLILPMSLMDVDDEWKI